MSEEIDLKALLRIILKKKKAIILGTLVAAALATLAAFLLPRTYQASLILEIGQIFGEKTAAAQFLEDPDATAKIMASSGILEEVRRRLDLETKLTLIQKRLQVNTYQEPQGFLPVLEVVFQSSSPQGAVEFLNELAGTVIERQAPKYRSFQHSMEKLIEYRRQKILALNQVIAAQELYLAWGRNYMEKGEINAEEFGQDLGELEEPAPSALDMLYLQGSLLLEKRHITDLNRFQADLDRQSGLLKEEIAEVEMEIVELTKRLELSFPTRIVSPAVPIDDAGKPDRAKIIIIAIIAGLAIMILLVFGREILRD